MANLENKEGNNEKSLKDTVQSAKNSAKKVIDGVENIAQEAKHAIEHPLETVENLAEQASKDVRNVKWWAKLLLIVFWLTVFVFSLGFVLINLPVTKRWAANQALELLNKDFKAEMKTDDISVDYFGDITIKGLKVKDYKGKEFFRVEELQADSNWLLLAKNAISGKSNSLSFDAVTLKRPVVRVITYKGDSISNFIRYVQNFDDGKKRDPKKPPFELNSRVVIEEGMVSIINENSEGDAGKWLDAKHFNLVVPKVKVKGADVFAKINRLSFETERWGKKHTIETFSADMSLTKKALSLNELTLNTHHSLLQGKLVFHLHNGSWQDFTHKVRWDLQLKYGSEVSGYDISYFAQQWDKPDALRISGSMKGALNDFSLNDFVIADKTLNIYTPSIHFSKLLEGDFRIQSTELSAMLSYSHLRKILPTFIAQKLGDFADSFGKIRFKGGVYVEPTRVKIPQGSLVTDIGKANVRELILSNLNQAQPNYAGNIRLENFNLAAITKNSSVGMLSGNFNIDGKGFQVNSLQVNTRSTIDEIEILDKKIRNITLDGVLDSRVYRGLAILQDPHAKAKINGIIDFKTSRISADVQADIEHFQLNYFTGQKHEQTLRGHFVGKMSMQHLNDLVLDMQTQGVHFAIGGKHYHIDQAKVEVYQENGIKVASVIAPKLLNGRITGKYNLADLGEMFQNGFNKVFISPTPRRLYKNQYFNFEMEADEALVQFFIPELSLPKGAFVSGSYDGAANDLVLVLDVKEGKYTLSHAQKNTLLNQNTVENLLPQIEFSKSKEKILKLNGVALRINTANIDETFFTKIENIEYDKQLFEAFSLSGKKENQEVLHLVANFKHGTKREEEEVSLKEYTFSLLQNTNEQGDYVVAFKDTHVDFNGIQWSIDTNPALKHAVVYRKKTGFIDIENLRLYSDDSEVFVKKGTFETGKNFYFDVELKNISLAKLMQMQKEGNTMNLSGVANGQAIIEMKNGELKPLATLNIEGIAMDTDVLGNLVAEVRNSEKENVFDINAKVVSSGFLGANSLTLSGVLDNSKEKTALDIKADLNDFDLKFANQFVKGIFSNLRGMASGELGLSGDLDNLDYNGNIELKKLGLKLDFTGVDYSFEDTVVSLSRGRAILNDIKVKDSRTNSKGSISGALYFETLSSMAVELIMRADNLMLLSTTQSNYDLFWGRVFGQGDIYVSGKVNELSIQTPNMRTLPNSVFTFNANSTSSVEEFKMLQFLKEEKDGSVKREIKSKGNNMHIDFNLLADEGATVNVVIGDDIGNISVRGKSENLHFQMLKNGGIRMDGGYTVTNGTFVSKAVLNKTFQIVKGSNIVWNGNAMAPNLDITATYQRTVANAGEYLGIGALQPINIMLQTKISQTLTKPKIDLDVLAQDVSSQIKETLNTKMSHEDEKLLQFGSILLLNRFNNTNTATSVANIAQNTGYDLLFKQLGSVLNTISNEFQIDLNYVRGDNISNTGDRANAGVSLDISPRVTLKTGLGIPLTKGTEYTTTNFLSGEGTLEYDASKNIDGSLIIRAYSKPMNIGMNGTGVVGNINQAYGMGVVYTRSFNRWFGRKKKPSSEKMQENAIEKDTTRVDKK